MNITTITATMSDGSSIVLFPVAAIIPTIDPIIEVDTKTESGVEETFVPAAPEIAPTA